MRSISEQIQLSKTLDVEHVDSALAELWKRTAGEAPADDDSALLRSHVANLLIFAPAEAETDVHNTLQELCVLHPCRAQVMIRENEPAHDIEMYLSMFCEDGKNSTIKRVCCEEITLKASGEFVSELPSAALPLVVPDLPIFLWWRQALHADNQNLRILCRAADRMVVDSADFENSDEDVAKLRDLFKGSGHEKIAVSDINWARLTSWRALLASFYDVPKYRDSLDRVDRVRIDFVPSLSKPDALPPQALLISGWLATRLGWTPVGEVSNASSDCVSLKFIRGDRPIRVEFSRTDHANMPPGRLAQVKLDHEEGEATFLVRRSADGLHLTTETRIGTDIQPGRVLPVRNRSTAQLLSREMEILCTDQVYEEALVQAVEMIRLVSKAASP